MLYLLTKIHKGITLPPGRSIISAVSGHTEKISEFVDHFRNPSAQRVKSYIRGTTHFLTSLEGVKDVPANTWLVTADVFSLYTMISNASGIHTDKEALHDLRPNPKVKPSNDSLIQLFEIRLDQKQFQVLWRTLRASRW